MPTRSRLAVSGMLLALALALVGGRGVIGTVLALPPAQEEADDGATPLGAPRPSEAAFELIGLSDRGNQDIAFVGYLTAIAGAEADLLFTRTDRRTEETARFTVVAELTPDAASAVDAVQVGTATGTLTVFFQAEAGAAFDDPETFGGGTAVAAFDLRTQDILYNRSASSTLAESSGDLEQTGAEPIEIDGETFRFGQSGARYHLAMTGVDARERSEPNREVFVLAGRAQLTGVSPESAPATPEPPVEATPEAPSDEPTGASPEAPPEADAAATPEDEPETPVASDDSCVPILSWYEATTAQVADIEVLVEFIAGVEGVQDLDSDQLTAAADALAVLAEQQRGIELPGEADAVPDSVADGMEAIGEAVAAAAAAVDGLSEDELDEAQDDLAAALADLLDADAAADALATECGLS